MHIKNIFYLCAFLLLAYACNKKVSSGVHCADVTVIDLDNAAHHDMLCYSSVLDTPSVIILETKDDCIIKSIRSVEIFDNKIYLLDSESNALYVFGADGTFLHSIGRRGKGHGEYVELSDFSIDRKNNIIYLWDEAQNKALMYDIHNSEFLSSVETERNGQRSFCMQYFNDKLYVNRTSMDNNGDNCLLKEIALPSGKQTASWLDAGRYNHGWNRPLRMPLSFFYSRNTASPKYVEMFSDTIMSLTDEGPVPAYCVKSERFVTAADLVPMLKESKSFYDLSKLYADKRIFQISHFVELDSCVTFQYLDGLERLYALYDVTTGETKISPFFVDDYIAPDNNIPMELRYSDEHGALAVLGTEYMALFVDEMVNKGRLNPDIDRYDELKKLTEVSNPVLFYHKYK